jgi:hypothetical protein
LTFTRFEKDPKNLAFQSLNDLTSLLPTAHTEKALLLLFVPDKSRAGSIMGSIICLLVDFFPNPAITGDSN